ncbi:hypothetical protein TSUD_142420 [Trifolium subterraneum]|uniref:Senescence domain-containing protein n=1 Tax=Trifolium subterraneum TaxID=3900 RepID=A0A2Z6MB96_TRISU|nr:hypothetical protein TSUD_142420 [Trifolium subterraneum]
MGCCFRGSKTMPPMEKKNSMIPIPSSAEFATKPKTLRQEILIQIPGCKVFLMDEGEAHELTQGTFMIIKIVDENVSLATIIKIGNNVQFPLTKDEPVVKVDSLHYLFSLPVKDGEPLSYGVTFPQQFYGSMAMVDSFLKEHSCFSDLKLSKKKSDLNWEEFAPSVENYNHFLAKAIAEKLSKSLLNGVGIVSGSMMTPVLKSQPGQAFLKMLPGEVLLASLDAIRFLKQQRLLKSKLFLPPLKLQPEWYGEEAGEATEHVFATAGHAANTAWNVSKIRKAINPASSAAALRNSAKNTSKY